MAWTRTHWTEFLNLSTRQRRLAKARGLDWQWSIPLFINIKVKSLYRVSLDEVQYSHYYYLNILHLHSIDEAKSRKMSLSNKQKIDFDEVRHGEYFISRR